MAAGLCTLRSFYHVRNYFNLCGSTALGEPAEAPPESRTFIHYHGGAAYTASWAKFALCLLGAMDWEGHGRPAGGCCARWCPFHPVGCGATRMVYPKGVTSGSRWVYADAEVDETVLSLKGAAPIHMLYGWRASRSLVAPIATTRPSASR